MDWVDLLRKTFDLDVFASDRWRWGDFSARFLLFSFPLRLVPGIGEQLCSVCDSVMNRIDGDVEQNAKRQLKPKKPLEKQKQPKAPNAIVIQRGSKSNLQQETQETLLCPNCGGDILPGGGGCLDCGDKLYQPEPKDATEGPGTLSLEFVLSLLDRWIKTFSFWKDYELQPFELTKKDFEKNTFSPEKVVEKLLRMLARPIPFSNKQKEMEIFHLALRRVTILAKTQENVLVSPNDFDLLFRRVFLNRLNMLKYLLKLHEEEEQGSSTQSSSLMDEWRIEQREVWTKTVREEIYQKYIEKHSSEYTKAMEWLKERGVLPDISR